MANWGSRCAKGCDFVLLITKIVTRDKWSGLHSTLGIMRPYDTTNEKDLSVSLYDTNSGASSVVSGDSFSELVDKLLALKVYGIGYYKTATDKQGYSLCVITKFAFSFLDYVESVNIVPRGSCKVDLSVVDSVNPNSLCLHHSLDEYNTLFDAVFCPGSPDTDDFGSIPVPIFDAVCLMPNCLIDGSFYIPVSVPDETSDYYDNYNESSHIVKVTCNNVVKAQSLIGRSQVLRPNLVTDLYRDAEI